MKPHPPSLAALRGIHTALAHHNADMEGEDVPAEERKNYAIAHEWWREECVARGWDKVFPHLKEADK